MREVDVAIVGAGAAGLAAAAALEGAPLETIVLEAAGRLGGRAHTIAGPGGIPLDLGAGWVHSASRNPLAPIAERLGLSIDRTRSRWGEQTEGEGLSAAEAAAFEAAWEGYYERLVEGARGRVDEPASAWLEPDNRFNPLIDAISTYMSGVELDSVSTFDVAAYLATDTEENWRVREGYGTAIAAFGAGAPVSLETPVTRIDHSGRRLRLDTPQGSLFARAAIVTVSTAVIARQDLRFTPSLPDKVIAAAGLPLGLADKLHLEVDEPEAFAANGHVFGKLDTVSTCSYHLRPFGRPIVEVFAGGRLARELSREGPRAFEAFALEELAGILGAGVRRTMRAVSHTDWLRAPFVHGSYSCALPGHAGDRAVLAAPVDDRLFFAGEATSANDFSTVHGAYATGSAAGAAVRALLTA